MLSETFFRESVSLHRIQADPGGIQDSDCGETKNMTMNDEDS